MSYSDTLARLARLRGEPAPPAEDSGASVGSVSSLPATRGTEEERRAWSREALRRASIVIARESPPGLGRWDLAWEMVEGPSKAALDALAAWEEEGTDLSRRGAVNAIAGTLEAWREAARAFRTHKSKGTPEAAA